MNSLEFQQTIEEVIQYPRPAHFIYEVEIYIENDLKFRPFTVVNLNYHDDYVNAYGSTFILELAMSMGDYMRWIYPNRNSTIHMKLIKKYVGTNTDVELQIEPTEILFRSFCKDLTDENLKDKPNLDLDHNLRNYKFELIEANVYDVRLRECGGIFQKQSKTDLIKFMYGKAAESIPENYRSKGVTIDKSNVNVPRRQLVVDDGTRLVDLPKYLQVKESGIYNYDIANFFNVHKRRWYVFAAFNTARHKESKYLLDIYLNPSNYTMMLDRTYKYSESDKKKLTVISTDNFQSVDSKIYNFLNQGNGVKFLLADKVFNEYAKVENNKLSIGKNHLAGFALETRDDDLQIVKYQNTRVTNNVAAAMSDLSRNSGMYVSVTWKHSRADLLIPGMPVNINYITENSVETKVGILHEVINVDTRVQAVVTNKTMFSTSILIIFVDDPNTDLRKI